MKKLQAVTLLLTACLACTPLAACGDSAETVNKIAYELPYYDGTYRQELDDMDKPCLLYTSYSSKVKAFRGHILVR